MFESEQDIINLVKKDAWMMSMIEAARCYICQTGGSVPVLLDQRCGYTA